jgi:hypothetical protein
MRCKDASAIKGSLDRARTNLDRVERESKILVQGKFEAASKKRTLTEARRVHLSWAVEWSEHLRGCRVCRNADQGEG